MMCIIAVSIAFVGWRNIKGIHLMHLSDYRTTVGTIDSSQMNRCGKANRSFCFDIIYSFDVDSVRYRSDAVNFFGHRSDYRSYVEKYVRKYPAGKRVVVYYEKGNPSFAILEPNTKGVSPLFPIAVSVLSAIVFAFIAAYLTGNQKLS